MSDELELLPNVGAEEGPGWREHLAQPQVRTVVALWRLLFGPGARVLGASDFDRWWPAALGLRPESPAIEGLPTQPGIQPWLATEDAQREARERGADFHGADPSIVARVHDKAFAQHFARRERHGAHDLRSAIQVLEPEDFRDPEGVCARIRAAVAQWPEWMRPDYTLKPRFGTSGRGRVGIRESDGPEAHRGAFERLRARGGAILEPWLDRCADLSTQLRVAGPEEIRVIAGLQLLLTPAGLYAGHRGSLDSRGRLYAEHPAEEDARAAAAELAGAAAHEGFTGLCGVDAFVYREPDPDGARERLRPIVELNARHTTGTLVAGLVRRALPTIRGPLELAPSVRRGFAFALAPPPGMGPDGWEEARERCGPGALLVELGPVPGLSAARPALLFTRDPAELDAVFPKPPARGRLGDARGA